MEFVIDVDREIDGLNDELANSIWQLLVYSAPYDTGNLRSAIKKTSSNDARITFLYDETQALYLKFLEEGQGFIKKYKGFISVLSLGEATKEVMYWAGKGDTTYSGVPIVTLRGRLNKSSGRSFVGGQPMGYEKKILVDTKTSLTAKERNLLSQLNYKMFNGTPDKKKWAGQRVITQQSPFMDKSRFTKKGFNL